MIIAGLYPCSFIDYPGRLSVILFVQGCNLRCGYCHNSGLIGDVPERSLDEETVLSFLSKRRKRINAVVISGGEPTLSSGLRDLVRKVKGLGFCVKLDTNGTRPGALGAILEEDLLDFVAMDLKDLPEDYATLCRAKVSPGSIYRSIRHVIDSCVEHEFRTTVVAPYHSTDRLLRMARVLDGVQSWVLQQILILVKDSRQRITLMHLFFTMHFTILLRLKK